MSRHQSTEYFIALFLNEIITSIVNFDDSSYGGNELQIGALAEPYHDLHVFCALNVARMM